MDILIMLFYITLYILVFTILAKARKHDKGLYLLLVIYITMITAILENSLNLISHFTEVSEQTPDATAYAVYGHWNSSLKNPYYDIINVASFWIALFHRVLGVNDVINATPNTILYFTIAFLISLSIYIVYQRNLSQTLILPAILVAFATPYITFTSIPPALSAAFALLILALILTDRNLTSSDHSTILILAVAGMLTHATAIAILIFSLLSVLILLKIYRGKSSRYLQVLSILVVIHIILSLARFIYTIAHLSIQPYYADFLRFLNFLASPGGVELRITRYEQWSSLFTSFSWTVYPALSAAYVLETLFKIKIRRYSHSELFALALSLAGLVLIVIGFVGSRFSNSFSREIAYPGYVLLFLGSFEALRKMCSDRVRRIIMTVIIAIAVVSGLFTIKNAPWLYVGKVPFLTYRPPTPSETLLAEKLLVLLDGVDEFRNIGFIQSFDPGTYLVKMIESGIIKLSNPFSPSPINVQTTMSSLQNNNIVSIVFNSPSLYVLWR